MPRRPRRNHSSQFKAKAALTAVQGDKTVTKLAQQYGVHANQVTPWKNPLLTRASEAFDGGGPAEPPLDVKRPHAKIGRKEVHTLMQRCSI